MAGYADILGKFQKEDEEKKRAIERAQLIQALAPDITPERQEMLDMRDTAAGNKAADAAWKAQTQDARGIIGLGRKGFQKFREHRGDKDRLRAKYADQEKNQTSLKQALAQEAAKRKVALIDYQTGVEGSGADARAAKSRELQKSLYKSRRKDTLFDAERDHIWELDDLAGAALAEEAKAQRDRKWAVEDRDVNYTRDLESAAMETLGDETAATTAHNRDVETAATLSDTNIARDDNRSINTQIENEGQAKLNERRDRLNNKDRVAAAAEEERIRKEILQNAPLEGYKKLAMNERNTLYNEGARAAKSAVQGVRNMDTIIEATNSGTFSGTLAPAFESIAGVLVSLGADNSRAYDNTQLIAQARAGSLANYMKELGARGLTDADMKVLSEYLPRMENSPEARLKVAETFKEASYRSIESQMQRYEQDMEMNPNIRSKPVWYDEQKKLALIRELKRREGE